MGLSFLIAFLQTHIVLLVCVSYSIYSGTEAKLIVVSVIAITIPSVACFRPYIYRTESNSTLSFESINRNFMFIRFDFFFLD